MCEFQRTGLEEATFSSVYKQHCSLCCVEGKHKAIFSTILFREILIAYFVLVFFRTGGSQLLASNGDLLSTWKLSTFTSREWYERYPSQNSPQYQR